MNFTALKHFPQYYNVILFVMTNFVGLDIISKNLWLEINVPKFSLIKRRSRSHQDEINVYSPAMEALDEKRL